MISYFYKMPIPKTLVALASVTRRKGGVKRGTSAPIARAVCTVLLLSCCGSHLPSPSLLWCSLLFFVINRYSDTCQI